MIYLKKCKNVKRNTKKEQNIFDFSFFYNTLIVLVLLIIILLILFKLGVHT
jgi:hypothetical protein